MKIIFFILITGIFHPIFGQVEAEKKIRVFIDVGYFDSSFYPAQNGGNYLSGGLGFKVNKDFWLNLSFLKGTSEGNFEQNPFFLNNKMSYNLTLLAPNFSKDWRLSKSIFFATGLGVAVGYETSYEPFAIYDSSNNFSGFEFLNVGEFILGLFTELNFKFKITPNIDLLISGKTNIPIYMSPENIMLGIGVDFSL